MTTRVRKALLGAALAAAAAAPALAQPQPQPQAPARDGRGPGQMFRQIDQNNDGRVTWEEGWAFVQQRFAAADADRDGGLTQQEMQAAMPPRPARDGQQGGPPPAMRERFGGMMFRGLDANRDGKVTLEEIRPMAEARFRSLDANGDNVVTRDEIPQPPPRRRPAPSQPG